MIPMFMPAMRVAVAHRPPPRPRPPGSTTNAQLVTVAQEPLERGEGAVDQVVDTGSSASDR
jgi:hypothetical protein